MSLATVIEAGYVELEAIHGKTLSLDGTTYACFASAVTKSKGIEDAGFLPAGDVTFHVRASLFTDDPSINSIISFDGVSYRLVEISKSFGGATYSLTCQRSENDANSKTFAFAVTENGEHLKTENDEFLVF